MTSPDTAARWGILAAVAGLLAGCVPGSTVVQDAGHDAGADANNDASNDANNDLSNDVSNNDGGDAAKVVTYTKDVQPIFVAKCSPCHADQDQGEHNIATHYEDASKPVQSFDSFGCWNDSDPSMFTMPKKVGECALILIMNGRMPQGAGCFNAMPEDPSKCLSSDQKATIAAWVAAGMPE